MQINIPPLPPRDLVIDASLNCMIPALVAAVVVLAATLVEGGKRAGIAGSAFAWLAALVSANAFRSLVPLKPGNSTLDWLIWSAIGATLAGLFIRGVSPKLGWLIRIAVAGAAAWLLVPTELRGLVVWLAPAFGGLILLGSWASERLATRQPGAAVPLAWTIMLGGAACILIHAHSARLMEVASVGMMACLGILAVSSICQTDVGGFSPAAAVLLPGVLLCGLHETYSELPWKAYACVAGAPMMLLPFALLKPSSNRLRAILMLVFVSLPVAAGCYLAMRAETISYG